MHPRIVARLACAALLVSLPFLPVRASAGTREVTQIAARTYDACLRKMNPVQQAKLQQTLRGVESRMRQDPEGHLSMAYMAMVTGGAGPQAQAVVAAWGARKYPASLALVNNLAFALHLLKDYPNAEKIYREALAIDGESLETMINLGNLYMDTDRDEEARKRYEQALEVDGEYTKAWEGLYGYHMKKKQYRQAMEIVAKIKPAGFILRGRDAMQAEEDAESEAQKLDHIEEGEGLASMERKIARIVETKPLNLAPVVAEVDPDLAEKIRDAMENLKVEVRVPDTPWPFDFSSARDHHVTSQVYAGVPAFTGKDMEFEPSPEMKRKAGQIEALSDEEIDGMVGKYLEGVQGILDKVQGLDMNDPNQLMEALRQMKGVTAMDPFGGLAAAGPSGPAGGPQVPGQPAPGRPPASTAEQLGAVEKPGLVTRSNYNNHLAHKANYRRYFRKICEEFTAVSDDLKKRFESEMDAVRDRQRRQAEQMSRQEQPITEEVQRRWTRERNSVRDSFVQEFGGRLTGFYRGHVQPAIRKVEESEALYIKNMANKNLRNMQANEMKAEVASLLSFFAEARAPVDGWEPESSEADEQLRKQIDRLKEQAPGRGEALPQLKQFAEGQRSLLEKLYEDTKFESQVGLVKLSYENAELTVGLNDAVNNQYMDLGVNIKDFSVSLTEGEGCEMGFKVSIGEAGVLKGVEADVGMANRGQGQKTTLYFDDSLNVVDARISRTAASEGFSASVSVADVELEGGAKIETTAEGTSSFVSSLKASVKDWSVWERQYKEELKK